MSNTITFESTYNGLSINTDKSKNLGCYTKILDRYHEHLFDMTDKHSKTMQVRLDLRYPQDESFVPHPKQINDFSYNFSRSLNRKRKKAAGGHDVDARLIMVPERHGKNKRLHIHGVVLVNGNAKHSYMGIVKKAEEIWKRAIGSTASGLVHFCNQNGENGIMMDRNKENFKEQLNAASYQASYLAKERGKDNAEKGSWISRGTSRPKK